MVSKFQTIPRARLLMLEASSSVITSIALILLISHFRDSQFLGEYVLVLAWAGLFQNFGNFGLSELMLRQMGLHPESRPCYLSHGIYVAVASSLVWTSGMAALSAVFGYPVALENLLLLASATILPVVLSAVCRSCFIALEGARYVVAIRFFENMALLSSGAYLILGHSPIWNLFVVIVEIRWLSALVFFAVLQSRLLRARWGWRKGILRTLVTPLAALGPNQIFNTAFWRVDIIMLSKLAPISAVASYGVASRILEILTIIPSAFAQTTLPDFSGDFSRRRVLTSERLAAVAKDMLLLLLPVGFAVLLLAEPILVIGFGEEYKGAAPAMRIMMVTLVLLGFDMLLGMVCFAGGHEVLNAKVAFANTMVNIVLNLVLIPIWSIVGASLAMLFSVTLALMLRYAFVSRRLVPMR